MRLSSHFILELKSTRQEIGKRRLEASGWTETHVGYCCYDLGAVDVLQKEASALHLGAKHTSGSEVRETEGESGNGCRPSHHLTLTKLAQGDDVYRLPKWWLLHSALQIAHKTLLQPTLTKPYRKPL